MSYKSIPYQNLSYFSGVISEYLDQKDTVKPLFNRFPDIANFEAQIAEKNASWLKERAKRAVLKNALIEQYKAVEDKDATQVNIEQLESQNTFTVTTGHQLNLFTGPLYFLYKIISTINLCKQLKQHYPSFHFVPVYWMATEDHDFEEIQFFNYRGGKIVFERPAAGPVGDISTTGLEKVYEVINDLWPDSKNGKELKSLFKAAYLGHDNLTTATRFLAHELFKKDGLVIVDGHDKALKRLMIPYFQTDLLEQTAYNAVSKTLETWPTGYKVQVNPREINLFYLAGSQRKRIIYDNGTYLVDETDIAFTKDEIIATLHTHPERFSPNVILRPLYQEVILPNLCYIGGGGEIAYWLELKNYFNASQVVFPMLLLRNSALLVNDKEAQKINNLDCTVVDLFLTQQELATTITKNVTHVPINFTPQKEQLKKQFKALYTIASTTDKSFLTAVAAQEKKQLNGLDALEKRLLKAQKAKYANHIERATAIQNILFPSGTLQERKENFSTFYLDHGRELITILKEQLNPLDSGFSIIKLPAL